MNLCIVTAGSHLNVETFIRPHIDRLPTNLAVVSGHVLYSRSEEKIIIDRFVRRLVRRMCRCLGRRDVRWERTIWFKRAFREFNCSVVLAEYGWVGVRVLEACAELGIPLIVHFHGTDAYTDAVLRAHRDGYRELFSRAAGLIAVSNAMVDQLVSLGAPKTKLHYNPYGVDCKKFGGALPAMAPEIFLAVGRFVEKKAPDITLRAFADVHRQFPQSRLRMIGDGPLLSKCSALAAELKIQRAVSFLGSQSHDEIAREMRNARCFVQHSVRAASGDCEGTPNAVIEACASGLPVVATRHAGIPDVVLEGHTGLLVDEHDVKDMAFQMGRILESPSLAARLGAAARCRIVENFSIEGSIEREWAIISHCAGQL